MDSLLPDNAYSPFLLLPSLVREEIFRHLFPQTESLWLGRQATAPYRQDGFQPVTDNQVLFPNAFWRRRHLEHQALAHWHPPETGYPAADAPKSRCSSGRNPQDVIDFLSLRLVCRQLCIEASDHLFRHGTLWWTIWNSEVALLRDIVRAEEEDALDAPLVGGKGKGIGDRDEDENAGTLMSPRLLVASDDPTACMLGRYLGTEKVPEEEWKDFVRLRKDQGLLKWIGQFRRVNVILQEENVMQVLEVLQAIVSFSHVRPKIQLTICGFKLYFDQDENYWGAYLPGGKNVVDFVLNRDWTSEESLIPQGRSGRERLAIKKVCQTGTPECWSLGESNYWLDAFKFCNIPFEADAWFGEQALDLKGKLIFYVLKDTKTWYTEAYEFGG